MENPATASFFFFFREPITDANAKDTGNGRKESELIRPWKMRAKLQLAVHGKMELLTAHWPHSQEGSLRTAARCMGDSWLFLPVRLLGCLRCAVVRLGILPDPEH